VTPKTSSSHPLQIAEVAAPRGGAVGVTFCPGKHQRSAFSGAWARDIETDVAAIRNWGASTIVTLVTADELVDLKVPDLGEVAAAQGLKWLHLPIVDVSTPTAAWETQWGDVQSFVHAELDAGRNILVHCKGGLGRAGTIAARILVERGMAAAAAITAVRAVRPGALETRQQEAYVHNLTGPAGDPNEPR
jgi:ADP-ribosyl-[dinitrogen reductase] hydrolase